MSTGAPFQLNCVLFTHSFSAVIKEQESIHHQLPHTKKKACLVELYSSITGGRQHFRSSPNMTWSKEDYTFNVNSMTTLKRQEIAYEKRGKIPVSMPAAAGVKSAVVKKRVKRAPKSDSDEEEEEEQEENRNASEEEEIEAEEADEDEVLEETPRPAARKHKLPPVKKGAAASNKRKAPSKSPKAKVAAAQAKSNSDDELDGLWEPAKTGTEERKQEKNRVRKAAAVEHKEYLANITPGVRPRGSMGFRRETVCSHNKHRVFDSKDSVEEKPNEEFEQCSCFESQASSESDHELDGLWDPAKTGTEERKKEKNRLRKAAAVEDKKARDDWDKGIRASGVGGYLRKTVCSHDKKRDSDSDDPEEEEPDECSCFESQASSE